MRRMTLPSVFLLFLPFSAAVRLAETRVPRRHEFVEDATYYNELLWKVAGLAGASELEQRDESHLSLHSVRKGTNLVARNCKSDGGVDAPLCEREIVHATEDLLIFQHDGAHLHQRLDETKDKLAELGYRPFALLAHHSMYVKADAPRARGTSEHTAEFDQWLAKQKHVVEEQSELGRLGRQRSAENKVIETDDDEGARVPDVNACLTTIPSHLSTEKGFAALTLSIGSLLNEQDYNQSRITAYLTIPLEASVREGSGYSADKAATLAMMYQGRLIILHTDHDVGPASRYLGCAEVLRNPHDFVIGFDDDIAYGRQAVSALVCAKTHSPDASWTGHRFGGLRGYPVGQGADGLLMSVGDLKGFPQFINTVQSECFKVDDLSISEYLTNYKSKPVKSLEEKQHDVGKCGEVITPIYKANCWTVNEKSKHERRICRPTVMSVNSLRHDKHSGGRGEDMHRCADKLALQPLPAS